MTSRVTIASLFLAISIFLGIRIWSMDRYDPCQAPTADNTTMQSLMVQTGDRVVEMPCSWWLARQPDVVQLFALLGLVAAVVFVLSFLRDSFRSMELRRNAIARKQRQ